MKPHPKWIVTAALGLGALAGSAGIASAATSHKASTPAGAAAPAKATAPGKTATPTKATPSSGTDTPEAGEVADQPGGTADIQDPQLNGSIQAPEVEGQSEADEAAALAKLAKVSEADAKAAALAAVPGGKVTGIELGNENGSVIYEVAVTDGSGRQLDVKVDACNAKVLAQEADDDHGEGKEGTEAGGEASEAAEAGSTASN